LMGKRDEPSRETLDLLQEIDCTGRIEAELAVTGKAFDVLLANGDMQKLLLWTRIYARMSPEGKVKVIAMHMDKGLICSMCGDGGNDCGALRMAHAGVALSDAEASVVSPFTSASYSISSVVDLLLEGRASLATSFATYKFLIIYGQLFSILKLICFYYGVIMCMMDYVAIDGIAVLIISYVMTLSKPLCKLPARRPPSALLGSTTVASIGGMQILNIIFMCAALGLMKNDEDYEQWPASSAQGAAWWELGDNWETTTIFCTVFTQFVTSGVLFSFGSHFRQPVYCNIWLFGFWIFAFAFTSYLLLGDPSSITKTFHIASEAFSAVPTDSDVSPVWARYYQSIGSKRTNAPAMSSSFRWKLYALIVTNLICNFIWERVFVIGPVKDHVRKTYRNLGELSSLKK